MPYKEWERAYSLLNDIMLKDPIQVILSSAGGESLYMDRQHLFTLFYAAIGSKVFQDYDADDTTDYLYTWERIITMVEACFRLLELQSKEQFHYTYSGDIEPE